MASNATSVHSLRKLIRDWAGAPVGFPPNIAVYGEDPELLAEALEAAFAEEMADLTIRHARRNPTSGAARKLAKIIRWLETHRPVTAEEIGSWTGRFMPFFRTIKTSEVNS